MVQVKELPVPPNVLQAHAQGRLKNAKIAIICASFNEHVLPLCGLAEKTLRGFDIMPSIHKVPGCLELPWLAQHVMQSFNEKPDVILALGSIIQGESYHFEMVCQHTLHGLQQVSLKAHIPVIYGITTTFNLPQAQARQHLARNYAINAIEIYLLLSSTHEPPI